MQCGVRPAWQAGEAATGSMSSAILGGVARRMMGSACRGVAPFADILGATLYSLGEKFAGTGAVLQMAPGATSG